MTQANWHSWHDAYDDPDSWQSRRLVTVRDRIRSALDGAPPGPLTVLAMVAGQGRDLIPELAVHPRRDDVTARLVELDERNTDVARAAARGAGLSNVDVVTGDAALADHYLGLAPADLVLICGLFVHIIDEDVQRVVRHAPALTKRGGRVIWTRDHGEPDLVPQICDWYAGEGFEKVWETGPDVPHAVVEHRSHRDPVPLAPGTKLFTFVGIRALRPWAYPSN
jgi:SAM-dependent methyltransferase